MIHLIYEAILDVIFVAIVSAGSLSQYAGRVAPGVGLGLIYGFGLAIVTGGIVLPLWLQTVGFPMAPPFPNISLMGFIGHGLYGLVLGAVYPVLTQRM